MDNNSNNNSNNSNGYISRMIRGITDANSIRPAVTPESIPQFLLEQNRDTNNINGVNFNSNYDTSLNSQDSRANGRDSFSKNILSENGDGSNKNKLDKIEISFHDFDNSEAIKIQTSNQTTKSSNSEVSNLNKFDNLSRKLKINKNPDIINNNNFKPETFFSKNKNNINLEKSMYTKNTISNRLQKNEIIKKNYEPTITINIGKITVRDVSNNNSKNIKDMRNEIRNSNKLSLSDYLRKRSAGNK